MFIEIPSTKRSIARRGLVHGVGINDASYIVSYRDTEGKTWYCPYYAVWINMLCRCYSEKYQQRNASYIGCECCEEWKTFSIFREWMISQDWDNKQLDKDLLYYGNKTYSADTCIFIDKEVNLLINAKSVKRKKNAHLPVGVNNSKTQGKYQAECCCNGKSVYLGSYNTASEAGSAYIEFKASHIRVVAQAYDGALKDALVRRAEMLE